jgi:acid-sensing ion channel, other
VLSNTYIKWQYEPDIASMHTMKNVRNIPFPAVTICPQTKTKTRFVVFENVFRELFEGFKTHGSMTKEAKYFESLLHICNPQLLKLIKVNESVVNVDEELVKIIRSISYNVTDSMLFCKWRNVIIECEKLFTEILTDQGVCYMFNALDFKDVFRDKIHSDFEFVQTKNSSWTLQDGYKHDDLNSYPWPIVSQSYDALRVILMTTDTDTDFVCQGSLQGFKVYFHLPNEFPKTFSKNVFIPLEQEATITIVPKSIRTSSPLMHYKPHLRKCYQNHEKQLKFFRTYTKHSCEIESLAEFVFKKCNCVRFSMPRLNDSKLCTLHQLNCLTEAERDFISKVSEENFKNTKCLQSCTQINYEVEKLTLTSFDYVALFDSYSYDLSDIPG